MSAKRVVRGSGAPQHMLQLNGDWTPLQVREGDHPQFVKRLSGGVCMHLFHFLGMWEITEDSPTSVSSRVVGMSHCDALHPNSIDDGAWLLTSGTELVPCHAFGFSVHGTSSKDDPFSMWADYCLTAVGAIPRI